MRATQKGVKAVAVTAGYMHAEPRKEFYAKMDAANVDLKAFTEDFYFRICGGKLASVLETLVYLVKETDVWTEITTLLIPGQERFGGRDRGRVQVDQAEPRHRRAAALHRRSTRTGR
jgi:pyruvate-formate lyase-activating enzyme